MRKISIFVMLLTAGIGAATATGLPRGGEIAGDGYNGWCSDAAHGVQTGTWSLASAYEGRIPPTNECTTVDGDTVGCICCNAAIPAEEGCKPGYIPASDGCYCVRNTGDPIDGQACTSRDVRPKPIYPAYIASARWRDVDGDGNLKCIVEQCSSGREAIDNDCWLLLNNWEYDCARAFGSPAFQGDIVEMSTGPHMCVDDNNEGVRCGCNDTGCYAGYTLEWNANYGGKMCVSKLNKPCAENEKPAGVAEGVYKEHKDGEYKCGSKKCYCHATRCTDENITPTDGKCISESESTDDISQIVIITDETTEPGTLPNEAPVVELQELSGIEATVDAAQVPFDQEVQYLYDNCKTDIITQGIWMRREDGLLWCAPGNKCIDEYADDDVVDCCCAAEVCADPYRAVGEYCIPAQDYRQNMVGKFDDCYDEYGSKGAYWPVDRFTKETNDVVPCVYPNSYDNEPYIIGKCYCYSVGYADSAPGMEKPTVSISDLVANLSKIESEFGLSKWRTAEGKFNYARLASDATAGIVLGTTGALVTAHVVKKKQVEDGFESLECPVDGQHVGDWGDVFRISGK